MKQITMRVLCILNPIYMKLKNTNILLFLFLSFSVFSSNIKFESINSRFGISLRETNNICKDKTGFIWTASKSAVLRISENDYRIYNLPYKTSDVLNVKLVFEDSHLYVYTNNGQLFEFDAIHDRFYLKKDLRDLLNNKHIMVYDMVVDKEGYLWIASSSGLYHYKHNKCTQIGKASFDCKSIVKCNDNAILFVYSGKILIINLQTYKTKVLYQNNGLKRIDVSDLHYQKNTKTLWIGTSSDGLFYYNIHKKIFSKIPIANFPNQPIQAINTDNGATLLIGIDGQGIWELSMDGSKVLNVIKENVNNSQSLPGDGVYDIFCDSNKRVWVSTYSGGLSYFERELPIIERITHQVNVLNSLSNNNVNKVLEDKNGNLWFATNNGINRWNRKTNRWTVYYQNKQEQAQVFLALEEDNNGNIWAGTYSSGVYVLNSKTGRELMHIAQGAADKNFSGKFVFDLFKDSFGDIWIGGVQGDLVCYEIKSKSFKLYNSQPVIAVDEYKNGKMLLACSYGLVMLNKSTNTSEVLLQGYTLNDLVVRGKYVWIATSGDGLLRYDIEKKNTKKFTIENGLPSNYVNSILYDNGYFWLGTENGLCKLSSEKPGITGNFTTFYSLSNISFNDGAKYKLSNGDLLFGTSSGAILFNPDKLEDTPFDAHIYIQDIKASGRSVKEMPEVIQDTAVNEKRNIVTSYEKNTFDIEVIPIGSSSNGVKLSWHMEGLEKEWSAPTLRRIITYTNLPYGKFNLRIKLFDNSLTHVLDERVIAIRIVPPFWATWWFKVILTIILGSIIYWILKFYTNKLKQQHSEDKIRFFTTTAHDLRTSLTLIQAPLQELSNEPQISGKGKYYLNLATEQSGRLSFVATQLLDFQKVDVGKGQLFLVMSDIVQLVNSRKTMFETACMKKNIKLTFTSNTESYLSAVDELKIEKVIDNLISNALKYSHSNSKIELSLNCDDQKWSLEVKDYGIGISESAQKKLFKEFYRGDNNVNSKIVGSGIGLLLVKNYVEMHSGKVSLVSRENSGATFTITIPFSEADNIHPAIDEKNDDFPEFIFTEQESSSDNTSGTEVQSEKRNHILVVEDNNDLQLFLKNTLERYFKVSVASDGIQAWEMIQKKMPDFVISDIMMPNMDGFDLCKLIKSTFDTAHIPVILLTALSERTNQLEGLNLGADDYITKPFDIAILLQRIKSIIRNRIIVREKSLRLIKQSDIEEPLMTNELSDKFIKKAYKTVTENMANCDFGKDEFASAMNASPSLLYKKIKAITNQSPVDFIKVIRLDYSLELLKSKKYSVTEVSEMCGFSSVGYFSTVFKKHFGKTPTEI